MLVSQFQACYRHRRSKAVRDNALATYRSPKIVVLCAGYVKPEFGDYKWYGVGHKSLVNGQPSSPSFRESRCGQRTTCGRHSLDHLIVDDSEKNIQAGRVFNWLEVDNTSDTVNRCDVNKNTASVMI